METLAKTATGPVPALWIDWMELEGPLKDPAQAKIKALLDGHRGGGGSWDRGASRSASAGPGAAAAEGAVAGAPGWLAEERERGGSRGSWASPARPRPSNAAITANRRASPPGWGVNRESPATRTTLGSLDLPPEGPGASTLTKPAVPFRRQTWAARPPTSSRKGSQTGSWGPNPSGLARINSGTGAPGWGWLGPGQDGSSRTAPHPIRLSSNPVRR
jgi:hypothetical protein